MGTMYWDNITSRIILTIQAYRILHIKSISGCIGEIYSKLIYIASIKGLM
jgi:hypothetical protein